MAAHAYLILSPTCLDVQLINFRQQPIDLRLEINQLAYNYSFQSLIRFKKTSQVINEVNFNAFLVSQCFKLHLSLI